MEQNEIPSNPEQWNVQDEFWYTIIEKCMERNESLSKECDSKKKWIPQLTSTLSPYLASKMSKLAEINPNINVDDLFYLEKPTRDKLPDNDTSAAHESPKLTVLSMVRNNVPSVEIARALIEDEKSLLEQIKRLKSKEKALLEIKSRITKLLSGDSSPKEGTHVYLNPQILQSTHDNLLDRNEEARKETFLTQAALEDTKKNLEKISLEIEQEKNKNIEFCKRIVTDKASSGNNINNQFVKPINALKKRLQELNCKIEEQNITNKSYNEEIVMLRNKYNDYKSKVIEDTTRKFNSSK